MTEVQRSLILVYDADSGIGAMLLDVLKKAVGREDCALCEITYGATGKRTAWAACEARLGVPIEELHRDQLPPEWGVSRSALPCVLARHGEDVPTVIVTREQITACQGRIEDLQRLLAEHG